MVKTGNASDGNFMIPIRYSNQDFDEKQHRTAKLQKDGMTWEAARAQTEAEYKAAQDAYWND